jgi:hypothetical protein
MTESSEKDSAMGGKAAIVQLTGRRSFIKIIPVTC